MSCSWLALAAAILKQSVKKRWSTGKASAGAVYKIFCQRLQNQTAIVLSQTDTGAFLDFQPATH
jgi:hypothetical protein